MATPAKIGKGKHLALAEDAHAAIQAAKNLAIQATTLTAVSDMRLAAIMDELAEHLETANEQLSKILLLIQAGDVDALEQLMTQLNRRNLELSDRNDQLTTLLGDLAGQMRQLQKKVEALEQGKPAPQWVVAPEEKP